MIKFSASSRAATNGDTSDPADGIAIIGMGVHYPGAEDLKPLWENILGRRRQFREMLDQRLPLADYYHPDPAFPDKTYGDRAAYIDNFRFDWAGRRVPKKTFDSTDIVHWLALEVARKAIEDAGFKRDTVPVEKTGVILGNTLTGEHVRSSSMRLRWPFVRRALLKTAEAKGMSMAAATDFADSMEGVFKSVFPPVTEDSLAGGLSNTIAGRICNFFNFDGGGYTVDGACSSSLIAVATAASSLVSGDLDIAIAGGVDVSLDTFELIGFAKTGALTGTDMSVYDQRGDGFLPGEGCGFAVMKRLADARADGDYVYAVLRGWAVSSDGKGGITAPSKVGQAKALQRAYQRAGYKPQTLDFIEGHGTGTAVGDRTELEGIALALEKFGETVPRQVGVTSFKSLVGHCKAAAGIGGFIKAVMAVNQRVIPPTANCTIPNPTFDDAARSVYPVLSGEVRPETDKMRAGVSAMGFGGINSHVTIESADGPCSTLTPSLPARTLLVSNQDSELVPLSAESFSELRRRIASVAALAQGISVAELADLAAEMSEQVDPKQVVRAAVLVSSPKDLLDRLRELDQLISQNPLSIGQVHTTPKQDIWVSHAAAPPRVGFLFPGQGSQLLNMSKALVERYRWAQDFITEADRWLHELDLPAVSPLFLRNLDTAENAEQVSQFNSQLAETSVAQPAICIASILWVKHLLNLGIDPVAVGGHSLGELTAFYAAGAFDERTFIQLAAVRGKAMSNQADPPGTMLSLACDVETAEKWIAMIPGYAVVANVNSSTQTVVAGSFEAIQALSQLAETEGVLAHRLSVANAFHSKLVEPASKFLAEHSPLSAKMLPLKRELYSSVDGQRVAETIRLTQHFSMQVTSQVDFISLLTNLSKTCDQIFEVGPGRVLSGLANTGKVGSLPKCLPVESKPGQFRDLNVSLASFFVQGGNLHWDYLYANRLVRPFIPVSEKTFIDNPCEREFVIDASSMERSLPPSNGQRSVKESEFHHSTQHEQPGPNIDGLSFGELAQYFSARSAFLASIIEADINSQEK